MARFSDELDSFTGQMQRAEGALDPRDVIVFGSDVWECTTVDEFTATIFAYCKVRPANH